MKWFFRIIAVLGLILSFAVPVILTSQGYTGKGIPLLFVAFMGLFVLGFVISLLVKDKTSAKFNKQATAEIIEVAQTGIYGNNQPQLAITISYVAENGMKIVTVLKTVVNYVELSQIQPGTTFDILYQEKKPHKVTTVPQETDKKLDVNLGEFDFVAKEKRWEKGIVIVGIVGIVMGFIGAFSGFAIIFLEERMGILNFLAAFMGFSVALTGIICINIRFRIVAAACIVEMLVLVVASGIVFSDVYNEYQATEEAIATVVNEYPTNNYVNDVQQWEVKLEYLTKDGQKITTTTNRKNVSTTGIDVEEGAKVTVYYNASKPKKIYFAKKSEEVREPLIYKLSDR